MLNDQENSIKAFKLGFQLSKVKSPQEGCRSISLIQFAQTGSANPWVLRVLSAKFVSAKAFEC